MRTPVHERGKGDAPRAAAKAEEAAAAPQAVAPLGHRFDAVAVHAAAGAPIAGGGSLPHRERIQRAFGGHDLGGVRAHLGDEARDQARAIGAKAFARGDQVAFDHAPSLFTAAHEAAHVVQQRGGAELAGGAERHERHADAVADRVVRGESAAELLHGYAGRASAGESRGASAPSVVQKKPSDFKKAFGANPLLTLTLLQQVKQTEWNTYVIAVKPYFDVSDEDKKTTLSMFKLCYARSRSLGKEYFARFTEPQQQLARAIGAAFEKERTALFGSTVGHLNDEDSPTITAADPTTSSVHRVHESQDDPKMFPLFDGLPTMAEVQQGALGDCYLLAAVASVVNTTPGHFIKHMRDNLDGTVTVKLYRAVDEPFQVTVQKSVVGDHYAKGTLWVKLLEKAYVASGIANNPNFDPRAQPAQTTYKSAEGGSSAMAMLHLTGKEPTSTALGKERSNFRAKAPDMMNAQLRELREGVMKLRDLDDALVKQKDATLKENSKADVSTLNEEIQANGDKTVKLMAELNELQFPLHDLTGALATIFVSQPMFEEFVRRHHGNPALQEVVRKLVPPGPLFAGPLGSGLYAQDEWTAFNAIKRGIDAKKPMTASTKAVISDPENREENERGVAGEAKVAGLAAKHAYSLIDYRPKEPKKDEVIMVRVRNPWGSYGRAYVEQMGKMKGVADRQSDGTFWIDLADLVAYFDSVVEGG